MKSDNASLLKRIDVKLILPVALLLIIGLVAIFVATTLDYPDRATEMVIQQGAWVMVGLFLASLVMFFDRQLLWKATPFLYLLGVVLMVLPLVFYSPELVAATGSRNWVAWNNQSLFQPSEFMKISYILMMAYQIVRFQSKQDSATLKKDFWLLFQLIITTIPVLMLLYLQKDLGTALVFVAIFAGMTLLSGISWTIILPTLLFGVLLIGGFVVIFSQEEGRVFLHNLGIDTYQLNRVSAWLDPFENAQTTTFQQAQSLIAIGSAGLWGKGFMTSDVHVPVRESDMIFTVIAENFGFLGGIVLISLYMVLIYQMIRVTIASNNRFYTFISTGFIMMLLFHVIENIGAATGLLPLTGIPLPFISQGGSSIISNLIGIGLLLSMSYQNALKQEEKQSKGVRKHRFIIENID
ncbi:FtsW/RodA/SpoVE family cell cycle protein [Streptococcus moroccensis]|uniref:Rod shape determining protein RodA n=1 Tax=Streptococcus moroccensis TaxID=1451356 RepID=A0ABT9YU27_9STRE|nr:FtsW/RodA/SpoVE family cell cycle protein [Streptococcus moroccensis]MDQ0223275.1 rod shape determining protein RodA [Streptococcus moroccensis]